MTLLERPVFGRQFSDYLLPIVVISGLLVLLVPLHPALMDFLLALNIAFSVVIFMTMFFIRKPLDFSAFPTLLLVSTLLRLVLNVGTTRLILSNAGTMGTKAAGDVILSFSQFVSGDNLVVGFIIFVIIFVIQLLVITKGSTRVSEVAARFTLDAMPGRQMSIDADLNAGIIDEEEALRRRDELIAQADFFGAMDGAGKFIRGDAIAGVLITLINIFGGLIVGMVQNHMSVSDALRIYTALTIGDGLVSQVPALLISISTGLLVTRSSRSVNLPQQVLRQVFHTPVVLMFTGCFLGVLVLTSLPKIPLLTLGTGCILLALHLRKEEKIAEKLALAESGRSDFNAGNDENRLSNRSSDRNLEQNGRSRSAESSGKNGARQDLHSGNVGGRIEDFLSVDPIELEIGRELVSIIKTAADLPEEQRIYPRLQFIRESIALDLGIIVPKIRIRDSKKLNDYQYQIQIFNENVDFGTVYPEMYMIVPTGEERDADIFQDFHGIRTTDPASGLPTLWITPKDAETAQFYGFQIFSPLDVVMEHLSAAIRKESASLLTRDGAAYLIQELKKTSPVVVNELIPDVLKLSQIQQILQRLLKERISVRPLELILETLGNYASRTSNLILLTEAVRVRLSRSLCAQFRDEDRTLRAVLLDPSYEDWIAEGTSLEDDLFRVYLPPADIKIFCNQLKQAVQRLLNQGRPPILLVSPEIRAAVYQITSEFFPLLTVLSFSEITKETKAVPEEILELPDSFLNSNTDLNSNLRSEHRTNNNVSNNRTAEQSASKGSFTPARNGSFVPERNDNFAPDRNGSFAPARGSVSDSHIAPVPNFTSERQNSFGNFYVQTNQSGS